MAQQGSDLAPDPGHKDDRPDGEAHAWPYWPNADADSEFDSALKDPAGARAVTRAGWSGWSGWSGWRVPALIAGVLLGCLGVLALILAVAPTRDIDAHWRVDEKGPLELAASADPVLSPHRGETVKALIAGDSTMFLADELSPQRSPRWIIDDVDRPRHRAQNEKLAAALRSERVTLVFANDSRVEVQPRPRGVTGLSPVFWLLTLLSLTLYTVALAVVLRRRSQRNLLYALMALGQAGHLLFIALEATFELGLPAPFADWDLPARVTFDLLIAAAMMHSAYLHPRRLPGAGWGAPLGWAVAAMLAVAIGTGWLPDGWWWAQGAVIGFGLVAIGLLSWSYRIEPHPFALVLRRFGIVTVGTWTLLSAALAAADTLPNMAHYTTDIAAMVWYVYFGFLLLLLPFLARSSNSMREFTLLAAASTIATSLDPLFVAVFSLGPFAALTLSLLVALGVYSAMREWILNQMISRGTVGTERMFEQLYRIARATEAQPERAPALLAQLLSALFEPLEVNIVEQHASRSRVIGDGAAMDVPVPQLGGASAGANVVGSSVMISFAHRGQRLFTADDARLTDRIVEQLRRAVHFDHAVEQGRTEERMRLAQDLHDDIGARLLTLMYKAQSPEIEDYVRHTLLDLKTLTRGLAASNHRLSHAAAEWKADVTNRLNAAHIALSWTFVFDEDPMLTVVHWSALTRILRELVSNTITHARAQHLSIDFSFEDNAVALTLRDDGVGRNPREWSHGLGLGGVRKRVKQLGGEVEWREVVPRGISCHVKIHDLSAH